MDTEEEGGISPVHRSSLRNKRIEAHIKHPKLESRYQKIRPTTWFETSEAYQRVLRNYDSALEECMLPVSAHRQQIENFLVLWIDCQDHSSMHVSAQQVPVPASPAPALNPLARTEIFLALYTHTHTHTHTHPGEEVKPASLGPTATLYKSTPRKELSQIRLEPCIYSGQRPQKCSFISEQGRDPEPDHKYRSNLQSCGHAPNQDRNCHHARKKPSFPRLLPQPLRSGPTS